MAVKEFSAELVETIRDFLGEKGAKFFQYLKDAYGTVSPVIPSEDELGVPRAIHFREGMQIRNLLRTLSECEDWTDHDLDDTWVPVILAVLEEQGVSDGNP